MSYGKYEPAKGKKQAGGITTPISRDEKIRGVKEAIRCDGYLIHYYELLLDDVPENHLSFQEYLRDIDERADVIKQERLRLIGSFNKASNGEMLVLQRHRVELEEKLKKLKAETPTRVRIEASKRERKKKRARTLREKLTVLEQELRSDGWTL